MALLDNAEAEIEVSGLPSVRVSLADDGSENPLLALLRPRITLRKNGVTLGTVAPYGEPRTGAPWALIGAGVLGAGLVVLVILAAKGVAK